MKILVTGGSGFVGLNVVEALLGRGDDVVVLGNADFPAYARGVFGALPGTLTTACADVADAPAVNAVFAEHAPEAVVHAAVITAGPQRELAAFDRVVDVNIKGTAHVLAAAAAHGTRRIVYVSSGSAYGAALFDDAVVQEETPPRPDSLYAITKYMSEGVCMRYRTLCGIDAVCARLGSVFGPWERDTGVRDTLSLPFQMFQLALAGGEIVLPRTEAKRDWIYSRDAASGIAALIDAPAPGHALYNLASGREWTNLAAGWCAHLLRLFPALRHLVGGAGEAANVSFLGERDRKMMSAERIAADTGFRLSMVNRMPWPITRHGCV
ncbi:MAG: NAD(P)-dependent oxidoreductase [Burkholderiales bacterium]|nr:NAD(P)-dependent oxidoreductase [Burkholderiales bacterium]